ncbi:TPA: hypothetical protein IDY88_000947 [Escherichia coli]|nr:hypothetical protein [Escherichia coli]
MSEVADSDVVSFFVFGSDKYRFALNICEVAFHQFLSAPGVMKCEETGNDDEGRITLTDGTSVIPVSVEVDGEENDGSGQLDNVFSILEF